MKGRRPETRRAKRLRSETGKERGEGCFAIETTPKGGRQSYKDLVRLSLFSCQSEGPYPSANTAFSEDPLICCMRGRSGLMS